MTTDYPPVTRRQQAWPPWKALRHFSNTRSSCFEPPSLLRWQKMISPSNWPFKKNHCIWTTTHASVVSFNRQNYFWGLYWQKITFLSNFEQKILHPPGWPIVGVAYPAEWPFRSQNAIEASDSPLPGGLWVKRLITHALCSLAYSDIAWCKLFLIFTMKCLFWVLFAYKTPYILYWLIIPSKSKKLTLKKLGWHFRAKFLDASNIYQFRNSNTFISYRSNIFDKDSHWGPGKFVTFHWRLFKIHVLLYQSDSYPKFPRAPVY